jgi:hypothetical protein
VPAPDINPKRDFFVPNNKRLASHFDTLARTARQQRR